MKKINKDTPLPIEFEEVDIKEGTAKLINLIKCYPYHPLKVEINRVRWMWDRDFKNFDAAINLLKKLLAEFPNNIKYLRDYISLQMLLLYILI